MSGARCKNATNNDTRRDVRTPHSGEHTPHFVRGNCGLKLFIRFNNV